MGEGVGVLSKIQIIIDFFQIYTENFIQLVLFINFCKAKTTKFTECYELISFHAK